MTIKQLRICVVTFPFAKAFITPLSNLEEILCSFSDNIYVITGGVENVMTKTDQRKIQTYRILYHKKTTNVLTRIARYIRMQARISWVLAKLSKNIDLCIFFMEAGALLPILTAKLLRKKVVSVLPSSIIRMSPRKESLSLVLVYLQTISYVLSDRIILYSKNLIKEWNLEKYKDKILIAHEHFLDFNGFKLKKEITAREKLVGYIGRLSREKGVLNFVKAIPEILKERPDLEFLIGGVGRLQDKIERHLDRNNLNGKVKHVGWIPHDELPNYLNELKVIVLPSYTEGLPNIVLEAMACGTPVLATPIGAISEITRDGETVFLLQSNDPRHIADRIVELLDKPELLERVGGKARKWVVENFSYEKTLESWRKILQELGISTNKENDGRMRMRARLFRN